MDTNTTMIVLEEPRAEGRKMGSGPFKANKPHLQSNNFYQIHIRLHNHQIARNLYFIYVNLENQRRKTYKSVFDNCTENNTHKMYMGIARQ